jgi:hypothetical protein
MPRIKFGLWEVEMPAKCEVCKKDVGDVFYDAKLDGGPWALMCEECFDTRGAGLGMGMGQKYDAKTSKKLAG